MCKQIALLTRVNHSVECLHAQKALSVFYFALQTGHLHEAPQSHLPASQLHGLPCMLPPHVCIFSQNRRFHSE
jgi:hypothetical protein